MFPRWEYFCWRGCLVWTVSPTFFSSAVRCWICSWTHHRVMNVRDEDHSAYWIAVLHQAGCEDLWPQPVVVMVSAELCLGMEFIPLGCLREGVSIPLVCLHTYKYKLPKCFSDWSSGLWHRSATAFNCRGGLSIFKFIFNSLTASYMYIINSSHFCTPCPSHPPSPPA